MGRRILRAGGDQGGGPDIKLERMSVVFQPVCKLRVNMGQRCGEVGGREEYLWGRGKYGPCWWEPERKL